jgi:hypothetical protein
MRTDAMWARAVLHVGTGILLTLPLAVGCQRRPAPPRGGGAYVVALPVHVLADTGRSERLPIRAPLSARVWLGSVTPARAPLPTPELPLPLPDSMPPLEEGPPTLAVDPRLKPPVLRASGELTLHSGWEDLRGSLELDVRVDETGRVSDAIWAGGRTDTALVEAARRCAFGMRFYPALREGRRVAVWCRQRFEVGDPAR